MREDSEIVILWDIIEEDKIKAVSLMHHCT